jgi:hypothetical protein
MREINYKKTIQNRVGPKLAYHGFKYDETQSYPPQGQYSFTRTYGALTSGYQWVQSSTTPRQ